MNEEEYLNGLEKTKFALPKISTGICFAWCIFTTSSGKYLSAVVWTWNKWLTIDDIFIGKNLIILEGDGSFSDHLDYSDTDAQRNPAIHFCSMTMFCR